MVVEDNEDTRTGMDLSLAARGYDVHVARSGHEALAMATEVQPAIVLLDLGLPDTDGFLVLQKLREQLEDTQVVILSARDRNRFEPQALGLGAALYLEKPIGGESIAAAIEGLVS